ncbi:hypothetical protein B0H15DRAFT_943151 [Mycena belliarum]|uniref:Ino eighty subunit 1 n=1 Tax=Mycena belliarum TaxID=1033014 RepID=A0AAD6UGR5_9AGAR|nr:hypothetical protein B0H15DRAFT_943151 [Mycena belliae]
MRTKTSRARHVAIDHSDGEPLTRADLQYDLLHHIFADDTKAFSDPQTGPTKLSFRDLFVNAILRSPKAKAVLKEKLALPAFATDFAMLALLTNVGRIATTMSFFAEMRTSQRTYHPIPSLQRTSGNLLDGPRIKHILKTSVLEGETKHIPATPAQVLARVKAGQIPPATLPNLIFVFSNHSAEIGREHLSDMEFVDLFLPNDTSSASRARAFLWLCYHYHEGPPSGDDDYDSDGSGMNPFSDPDNIGKPPRLVVLSPDQAALENVEPEEDKALAKRLIAQREAIVQEHLLKESAKESQARATTPGGTPSPAKTKGKRSLTAKAGTSAPLKRAAKEENSKPELDDNGGFTSVAPEVSTPLRPIYRQVRYSPSREPRSPPPPPPRAFSVLPPEQHHSHRYSPYKDSRPRTMLQHAWHVIASSDPLADSDEEPDDEHVRRDHAKRLSVIARVRGKIPTPEPEGLRTIPLRLSHWHDDLFV